MLLLGYPPDVIQDHIGDGAAWELEVSYSVSGPDDLTATRIRIAREQIEPTFLLMCCDDYWPMRMDRMSPRHRALAAPSVLDAVRALLARRPQAVAS
jgi:NDP-sugar pyrophosphorylase family protein